jgi:uncharacterized membrane protein
MTIRPANVQPDVVFDVQTVAVALDADARKDIQARMKEIAEKGDTRTKAGLAAMLNEATGVLLAHEGAFSHAWIDQALAIAPAQAQARFGEAATRARQRFPVEVIRNAYGQTTRQPAPKLAPSTEPGVVIVTLVLATRARLAPIGLPLDRAAVRAAIAQAGKTTAENLVAMEVIWSPAEENDRVSVTKLEQKHPELERLA